ncbi:MAG: glycosyltransferase family 1 protein [Verrucomicrobia bacterium]|nr:glycosyltransferase family 1 protein [Verrucomicrobiota bacterium]
MYPFIGLGKELRSRGHGVMLLANENFGNVAVENGLTFRTLISREQTDALLGNPNNWHPIKSAQHGARWMVGVIDQTYEISAQAITDPETVILNYPAVFAGKLIHELQGNPLISMVPMPWMLLSRVTPPKLAGPLNLPRNTPPFLVTGFWHLLEVVADQLVGPPVNKLRKQLGMRKISRIPRWSFSDRLTLGMFPDWYAPRQPDWPKSTEMVGFARFDGSDQKQIPAETLDFIDAGRKPIAITFGTGMRYAKTMFENAARACTLLKRRAVLMTTTPSDLPTQLPETIHHCPFAPFGKLFQHCAAIVHHGGIGTTAQAIAAGIPQLIMPLAWDQYDNADRVTRLKVGSSIKSSASSRDLAFSLKQLLDTANGQALAQYADQSDGQRSFKLAADKIEATRMD